MTFYMLDALPVAQPKKIIVAYV